MNENHSLIGGPLSGSLSSSSIPPSTTHIHVALVDATITDKHAPNLLRGTYTRDTSTSTLFYWSPYPKLT
jgi:hypothetical protein